MYTTQSKSTRACRDDHGRTALHWASSLGLAGPAITVLRAVNNTSAIITAAVAEAVSPQAAAELPVKLLILEVSPICALFKAPHPSILGCIVTALSLLPQLMFAC